MSQYLTFGRWCSATVLFVLLSVAGVRVVAAVDCNPGFGMCNHHNRNPGIKYDSTQFTALSFLHIENNKWT